MSEDIEGAIEFLHSKPDGASTSVIDHIGQTLIMLADHGSDRPLDYFEPFSYILKEERDSSNEKKLLSLQEKYGPDIQEIAKKNSRIQTLLFPKAKLTADGEEEEEEKDKEAADGDGKNEEEETVNEGEVPNIIDDMKFANFVGVGLNEQETIILQNSIQKLIRSKPLSTARFWGKILGVEKDFYVVEAEFNEGERPHKESEEKNEEEDKNEEKVKIAPMEEDSGPNQFSYFVSTQLGGPWTLLPDVKPQQIVASRSIRQMFSGVCNGEVKAPPGRFDWQEQELLRATIARINHSCTIAPKGLFQAEEEPEEDQALESNAPITQVEEPVYKPILGLQSFVHRVPAILPQGRCEFWAPETEEEEKEIPTEKGPPILRPLSEDEKLNGTIPSWSIRQITGVKKLFWLRSNTWPGLHVVSSENGNRLVTMYFGTGMKSTEPIEWPPLPVKKVPPPPPKTEEEEEKGEEEDKPSEPTDPEPSDANQAQPQGDPEPDNDQDHSTEGGNYDGSTYDGSNN